MADLSVSTDISTSNSSIADDDQRARVAGEMILKPCPQFKDLPKLEEADSRYKEIILTLPKEQGWMTTSSLRNYKGFWFSEQMLLGILAMEEAFEPRPSDVIVASFMKTGTTWLKALAFTIIHRDKYDFSSHPLLKLNPHDCVRFIEFQYAMRDEQYLETLPSPRVLGTHTPYSLLPESMKASNCRIVYIYRDLKDVIVSLWHMIEKAHVYKQLPFNEFFELFCKGQTPSGPFWDHVLGYYTESLQNSSKVLFIKYEEMMKNPVDAVLRIASFFGCPFSEEEMKLGVVKEIAEFCSFNKLKELEVNKTGIGMAKNDVFFRKGVVGDWQNYMTNEMAAKLDGILKDKFCYSDFNYGASV